MKYYLNIQNLRDLTRFQLNKFVFYSINIQYKNRRVINNSTIIIDTLYKFI